MAGGAAPTCAPAPAGSNVQITVHHIGVVARDVAASIDFYVRLLDGEVLPTPFAGHTLIRAGEVHLAIVPWQEGDPEAYARGHHLALRTTEHRPRLLARIAELGCAHEVVRGRVYVRGPEGFTVELVLE